MESTRIPMYNSKGSLEHPTQMRVQGRYGETSIPASSFLNRTTHLAPQQKASYQLASSNSQPNLHQVPPNLYSPPFRVNTVNQVHHPMPLYNYGIQQNCTPCGPAYRLPVYYQQPIQVRQQWQRPLDPHVKQQQWRYVKTQDKGGIVKYVNRQQDFVPTYQSQWDKHYDPKVSIAPIIPPTREKRTCCTPLLFALLGLLALIGLIVGLIALLNAHGAQATQSHVSNPNIVNPTPGTAIQQIPAVPVPITPQVIITPPNPITRPTFTDPISVAPSQKISTSQPIISNSSTRLDKKQAVNINYGYKQNTYNPTSNINYDNDYQLRYPINNQVLPRPTSQQIIQPVQPSIPSNQGQGFDAVPIASEPIATKQTTSIVSSPITSPQLRKNYDFRIPQGYKVDQNGMIVKI